MASGDMVSCLDSSYRPSLLMAICEEMYRSPGTSRVSSSQELSVHRHGSLLCNDLKSVQYMQSRICFVLFKHLMLLSLAMLTIIQITSFQNHFHWRCIANGKVMIPSSVPAPKLLLLSTHDLDQFNVCNSVNSCYNLEICVLSPSASIMSTIVVPVSSAGVN